MAIRSTSVSVGTTATLLTTGTDTDSNSNYRDAAVRVPSGGVTVSVGGPDVTTANGFPLAAGEMVSLSQLQADSLLYGVVASGTQAVSVLQSGV